MNENQVRIYDSAAGVPVNDPEGLLDLAQDIVFSTVYTGGIFEAASFFIPCNPTHYIPIKHTDRLQIKNGLTTVWEGYITSIAYVIGNGRQGVDVQATGAWGFAHVRYQYNRWIDRRFQSDIYGVWTPDTATTGGTPKTEFDQNQQLLLRPKDGTEWGANNASFFGYVTNASSNVKRVVFDYDFGTRAETNPIKAKKYTQVGGSYTSNLTNMIDGDSTTSQTVSMAASDILYIAVDDPHSVTGFRFDFGATVNANASVLSAEVFTTGHTWDAVTITDGTSTGGKCWAQDGTVTFSAIDDWDFTNVNGSTEYYYMRFKVTNALTANVVINDVYVVRDQGWTLMLYDITNAATLWSTTTPGAGTQDITLTTSSAYLIFRLSANAEQKAIGTGIYGKITNLALVAESWDGTAKTTVTSLLQDMVHYLGSPFADNYTFIASNTYDLLTTGFVADDLQKPLAQNMIDIGKLSATNEPYSVGALESDAISGTNTSALVYYEKVPALSDYDYAVRIDEENISGIEIVTSSDLDTLFNRSFVTFIDDTGKKHWANLNDYAALDDSTSQAKYKQRTIIVDGGQAATRALAGPAGAVVIKRSKDLTYYMRNPLQLIGTIRRKDGASVPVSQIRAGKRIKIENFIGDVGDVAGSGLTFLISHTSYDDASGVMTVTAGVSDAMPDIIVNAESSTRGSQTK